MNSVEKQLSNFGATFVNIATSVTPLLLIFAIFTVAGFSGWLEFKHQEAVFGSGLSALIGFVLAFFRFGAGLGGIKFFKESRVVQGVIFVLISIGLTLWTSYHVPDMAPNLAKDPSQAHNAEIVLRTVLWVALIGEIMIAIYMHVHNASATDATQHRNVTSATDVTQRSRNSVTDSATQQRNDRNGALLNSATQQDATPKRNQIGYVIGEARNAQNPVYTRVAEPQHNTEKLKVVTIDATDEEALQKALRNAKSKLRTYEYRLRNGQGNAETQQRNITKWRNEIERYEDLLQSVT